MRRRRARILAGVLVAAGLLIGMAPQAGAATEVVEVEGSAFSIFVDAEFENPCFPEGCGSPPPPAGEPANGEAAPLQVPITFGPAPVVTLPPDGGGPFTDSLASVDLAAALVTAGVGEVSTEGALGESGFARSSASLADFDLGFAPLSADLISSECSSDATGPSGSTSIAGGILGRDPLAASPPPNTVIPTGFGSVTLNRQVVDGNRIEVTAMVIDVDISVDNFTWIGTIEISQSVCGVTTAATPDAAEGPIAAEPGFTG